MTISSVSIRASNHLSGNGIISLISPPPFARIIILPSARQLDVGHCVSEHGMPLAAGRGAELVRLRGRIPLYRIVPQESLFSGISVSGGQRVVSVEESLRGKCGKMSRLAWSQKATHKPPRINRYRAISAISRLTSLAASMWGMWPALSKTWTLTLPGRLLA